MSMPGLRDLPSAGTSNVRHSFGFDVWGTARAPSEQFCVARPRRRCSCGGWRSAKFCEVQSDSETSRHLPKFGPVQIKASTYVSCNSGCDFRAVQRSALCRSRRELSNEYFLAKFGFDTAENGLCKVCPLSVYRSPSSRPPTLHHYTSPQYDSSNM